MNYSTTTEIAGLVPIVVAATGHRVIPSQDEDDLRKAVSDALGAIAQENPNSPCILISALAEGADRLIARCALDLGWQVGAILPLDQFEYEKDFIDAQSVIEFRDLLNRSSWVKVIAARFHTRPDCYQELGLWLSQQAQVLIALWDGENSNGPGGTAEVIKAFREGVALAAPVLPDAGPVIHIQARRMLNQLISSDFKVGSLRTLPACPAGLASEGEINRWRAVRTRIENFNKDALSASKNEVPLTADWSLPLPGWDQNIPASSKIMMARNLFFAADALSVTAQRERDHMFVGLLSLSGLAILLSQIYSSLFSFSVLLACSVGLIAFGACWYWISRNQNLEGRYLDYRALAEACRVQYFWKLVGIEDSAAEHYLREQRDELEWIRQGVQTTELGDECVRPTPLLDRLKFVRNAWIQDQLNYFSGTDHLMGKATLNQLMDEKWSRRSRILFALGMTGTLATAVFHMIFANTSIPAHDWALRSMIVGYCLLFAGSGLVKVYQDTRAFAEHAKLYQRMALAMQLSLTRLDAALTTDDVERAIAIVKALGLEALAENGNWLLMHRERPVLVQGIG